MKLKIHATKTITNILIVVFASLQLFGYSQLEISSKKTIENIFYGVNLKTDFLSVYNTLSEQPDCYDITPTGNNIISVKAKKSKTFNIGENYSFPYFAVTYNFENKKLARRMIELNEEKSKDNFQKATTLFTAMAAKTDFKVAEKELLGEKWTEYSRDFLDKSGKVFAQIFYKKSIQGGDNLMSLQIMVYDYNVL